MIPRGRWLLANWLPSRRRWDLAAEGQPVRFCLTPSGILYMLGNVDGARELRHDPLPVEKVEEVARGVFSLGGRVNRYDRDATLAVVLKDVRELPDG